MIRFKHILNSALGLTLVAALTLDAWAQSPAKAVRSLSEADLSNLIELSVGDDAVIARLKKSGIAFEVDDTVVARLKKLGASDPVIAAVREVGRGAAGKSDDKRRLMLWVEDDSYDTNHLMSEITINGKSIGQFKAATKQYVDADFKVGWNDISIKTSPTKPTVDCLGLWFTIGPVLADKVKGKQVMEFPLWSFKSRNGWKFKDGKFVHDFGPATKDVTLSFRVYFAGVKHEGQRPEEGDYVLRTKVNDYQSDPVTAIVYVNGTPLSSIFNNERQIVITPMLKRGRNEIRLITTRVKNNTYGTYQSFGIIGPMIHNVARKELLGADRLSFKSMGGWERTGATQQLVYKEKPDAESSEDVFTFVVDQEPKSGEAVADVGNKRRMMLWAEAETYDRNHMASEITLNGRSIGVFNAQTRQYIDADLKPGWNDVSIKTKPTRPTVKCDGLWFKIGPVFNDEAKGAQVMEHTLWSFTSRNGWRFEDGRFMHDFGPKTKEVTLSFRLYFAGLEREGVKPDEGDFVLHASGDGYQQDAVTATVFVNGTALNTVFNNDRQVVITPLLKQGRNEIRVVTGLVRNNTYGRHQGFKVVGPLEYNAARKTLEGPKALDFKSMTGWTRSETTQLLVYKDQPTTDSSEEVFTLTLTKVPNAE